MLLVKVEGKGHLFKKFFIDLLIFTASFLFCHVRNSPEQLQPAARLCSGWPLPGGPFWPLPTGGEPLLILPRAYSSGPPFSAAERTHRCRLPDFLRKAALHPQAPLGYFPGVCRPGTAPRAGPRRVISLEATWCLAHSRCSANG